MMTTDNRFGKADDPRGQTMRRNFGRAVTFGAVGAAIIAGAGLLGYVPGLRLLGSLRQDYIPMAPSTASCFLLLGAVLWRHAKRSWHGAGFYGVAVLVILATLFSLLDVVGAVVGIDLNYEDRLTAGMGTLEGIPIGRMSPVTGATFFLAGLSTLTLLVRSRVPGSVRWPGDWSATLGVLTALVGTTVLLAYLYGTPLMYGSTIIPMAATTAIAFLSLGLALTAAAGPASFPLCLVIGDSTAAQLSRVFLPVTVLAVFFQSVACRFAPSSTVVNEAFVSAVLVVVMGTITALLVARVAHTLGANLDELTRRLRQSEEQQQSLLQTAMDGFWMTDAQGRLLDVNQTYCRMSGYTAQELLTMHIGDLEVAESPEEIAAHIRKVMAQGEDRFESRHRRKDGSCFDVEISAQHRLAHGGGFVVFSRDITERKQAEAALRHQQEMLARTEQMAHIGGWEFDVKTGEVVWSQEMYRIFQWPPAMPAPSQDEYRQLLPPREWKRVEKVIGDALLTGAPYTLNLSYRRTDGELRHGLLWGLAERDTSGDVVRLVGSFQDITALKKAEAESERLLTAIEQAGEIIFVTDEAGTVQYVNPAFEAVTGYDRQEVIGRNSRLLRSDRHDDSFYLAMDATLASGKVWQGRMVNKRKDGSLYTVEASVSPVLDGSGNIVSYVAVNRDITERLKMEAQLLQAQKMESVGRLAGGVAHDYNNMLSVIVGYAELVLERLPPDDPLQEYLREIIGAAIRSADITRQLLAFARKQTIAPVPLDLNETVERMLKMLRRLIGEDIDLAWLPATRLWPVRMDPSQVDQILANLCVNARDAISEVGRVTIETDMTTFDETYCAEHPGSLPGEYVVLVVSDDGCGMDQATMEKIFEPFFTTKDVGQGTGLGLATVYGIVKQNRGFINVYSEPGKGTTFKIYFARHADAPVEGASETVDEIPLGHGEVVLVVEDEESILQLAQKNLEKLGYTVLIAPRPQQALQLAGNVRGDIDLLITDVVMPEMNGKELANRLRQAYPHLKTLFMSGYTADVIAHRGVLEEGVHFMQKPFSRKTMALKIREALGEQGAP